MSDFTEIMKIDPENLPEGCKTAPSNRIKLMIKNMLENKENGWAKQKGTAELQTKEAIEKQELRKMEEK